MNEDKKKRKLISIIVILAFIFHFNSSVLLATQEGDEVLTQFNKAKSAFMNGQYKDSISRLERIIDITIADPPQKSILGQCYLLLGAIYEKEGKAELARENYQRAKTDFGIEAVEGVDLSQLTIYREEMADILINEAKKEFLNGQYAGLRAKLERINDLAKSGKKDILGQCFLLFGALDEKERKIKRAEENYRKARECGIKSISGIDLDKFSIYKKVMKERTIEHPVPKTKKKFPILLVVGGVVVVVALAILLLKKKAKYTLTTTVGIGVDGTPTSGSSTYEKGSAVQYNYTLQSGYENLVVTLDETVVDPIGTIRMDRNHALSATSNRRQYTLIVTKGTEVNGAPDTGTTTYNEGDSVSYNYSRRDGYSEPEVTLDGFGVPVSGYITMNQNHIMTATARVVILDPVVKITSPDNNSSHTRGSKVVINVNATSAIEIDRVEFFIDEKLVYTDLLPSYKYEWDTIGYFEGPPHHIEVIAYDAEQRYTKESIYVTVTPQ